MSIAPHSQGKVGISCLTFYDTVRLEPFLLLLSSVFVPLFGVILGRLAFGTHAPTLLAQARVVNALSVALWLAGIAVYHLAPKVLPGAGSALPALAFSFALAWATRPNRR